MNHTPTKPTIAKEPKPPAKKREHDGAMAIFFICFGIFLIVMVTILTVQAITAPTDAEPTPTPPTVTPGGNSPLNPGVPVFSGGSIGIMPHKTESTVTLSGELGSAYGVLVDVESGKILAEKGGDTRFNPASMTKVMTLIVACEHLTKKDLDREVIMTDALHTYVRTGAYEGAGVQNFDVGDGAKIRDLLYGIGVESYADCTMMVVQSMFEDKTPAEAEAAFVALMQEKCTEMGLQNTRFDNVIGHEGEGNYSTAAEIAAIMMYALGSDLIRDILSTEHRTISISYLKNGEPATFNGYFYSTLFNVNGEGRIAAYEKAYGKFELKDKNTTLLGGKTGSLGTGTASDPWSYSLVSFAEKDGKLYIAVTGETGTASTVMKDAKALYDQYIP